ncbi:MAG: maleylacetoacetate isomerase [Pseudomonadota bacterium]
MKLYTYWRSSAAYRVRIALALKAVPHERVSVSLHPGKLEQLGDAYKAVNPQMRLPSLEVDGRVIAQSMAILEWLEERYPDPPLLPTDPWARAEIRAFAQIIASDTHPLQNTSVLRYLEDAHGADQTSKRRWAQEWMGRGLAACEALAEGRTTPFLFGETPSFADICLVPQLYKARRFDLELAAMPRLLAVETACLALPAFQVAAPDMQPDAS